MDLPQLNEQDLDMDIDSLDLRLEVSLFRRYCTLGCNEYQTANCLCILDREWDLKTKIQIAFFVLSAFV